MYWKIIKKVHTEFKGIVSRLAYLTDTSEEWWNSHGRAPSTFNQQNSGKKWANVEHYLEGIDLYEQSARGAGVMLSEEINLYIRCKYTDCRADGVNQREIVNSIIKESGEAATELNKKDFDVMSLPELEKARDELFQSIEKERNALDIVDAIIKARIDRQTAEAAYKNISVPTNGQRAAKV